MGSGAPQRFHHVTHTVCPGYDAANKGRIGRFFEDYRDMRLGNFMVADGEIEDGGRGCVVVHECSAAPAST